MRGGENGYGCPWYTWPGSADSNSFCGLCSECYKSCPSDNIGLFIQKPLTSVIEPTHRRQDVAVAISLLLGLVLYQQYNALGTFTSIDSWLNSVTLFPHYPNPIDYFGGIAIAIGFIWLVITGINRIAISPSSEAKNSKIFTSFAYGLIPITGFDYFARQLPKFFKHVTRVPAAVASPFGVH